MAQLNDLLVLGKTSLIGDVNASGEIIASKFIGDGSSITNIKAESISSGILPVVRGGTGTSSLTAGRMAYTKTTDGVTTVTAGYHYVDNTHVAVGSTSSPSYTLYVGNSNSAAGTFGTHGNATIGGILTATNSILVKGSNPYLGFINSSGTTVGYAQYVQSDNYYALGAGVANSIQIDSTGNTSIPGSKNFTPRTTQTGSLGTTSNVWKTGYINNLHIYGSASETMTAASTNPKITFSENGSQPVHLIYTDYDSYRTPAGLKVIGGTSATPAWFEVEGAIHAGGNIIASNSSNSVILQNDGGIYINTNASGGWARSIKWGNNNTTKVQLGAFGDGATFNYLYIGSAYNSTWMKVDSNSNVTATTFTGALSGNASSATKFYATNSTPTASTQYFIPFIKDSPSGNKDAYFHPRIYLWDTGSRMHLCVGEQGTSASDATGAYSGGLTISSGAGKGKYVDIIPVLMTEHRTINIPDANGLMLVEGNYKNIIINNGLNAPITITNTTSKPAIKTDLPILKVRYQNSGGSYYTADVISAIGTGETGTTVNNACIRMGSTSGCLALTAGECGKNMITKHSLTNTENIYLLTDAGVEFYVGCANDAATSTKALTVTSSGVSPGVDNIITLGTSSLRWKAAYATNFYGSGANLTSLNASNISSGTLAVARGGTGKTTGVDACNYFLNELTTGSSVPSDGDYYISQYAGGGTTTTTYHRRPVHCLWNYINKKSYGTCSTAAATAAKTVSCANFALAAGAKITIKFTVTNTAENPTLNVNSTGAKPIFYRGSAISKGYLAANRVYTFIYDGTNYELIGDINTNTTNSTGTTNKAGTKLFLAGATSQASSPTTYSNSGVYIGTDNCLYSNSKKVATSEELDEVKTSVSEGKTLIAAAVTDKGVQTAATDTFQTMANNIRNISELNNIILTPIALSQKTAMSSGRGSRNLSLTLDTSNTFLIVCNSGGGEYGTSLGSSDGDFGAHAEIFLIHKGQIIFGIKQTVGLSTTYGRYGSTDYISLGETITTAAIDTSGVFTYTLTDPETDVGGFDCGHEIYGYSIWQLN